MNDQQHERYLRHLVLKEVGPKGQEKLLQSSILIIGAGGLGSPAALYLAAAGIGRLGIVDKDKVELTNLQRQILHGTSRVGRRKTESAKESIGEINPEVKVEVIDSMFGNDNALDLVSGYDFVIDGTDNFDTKFLINDVCVQQKKPFAHAGVVKFKGQTITVVPGRSACLRCVFDSPPPTGVVPDCCQVGILGVLPGVIGCIQATEGIKCILGIGELLTDSLLTYDALSMEFRKIGFSKNPDCKCSGAKSITSGSAGPRRLL